MYRTSVRSVLHKCTAQVYALYCTSLQCAEKVYSLLYSTREQCTAKVYSVLHK